MQPLRNGLEDYINQQGSAEMREAVALRQAWEMAAGKAVADITGNVIFDKKDRDIVVIYTISSLHKAELEAEKELYRLQLTELLRGPKGQPVKEVRFVVSRNTARRVVSNQQQRSEVKSRVIPVALTESEDSYARKSVEGIDNKKLKLSLYKAMKTNLEWKKGKNVSKTPQERL